jgi:hypothetical protein
MLPSKRSPGALVGVVAFGLDSPPAILHRGARCGTAPGVDGRGARSRGVAALRPWQDSWEGIGRVAVGMAR